MVFHRVRPSCSASVSAVALSHKLELTMDNNKSGKYIVSNISLDCSKIHTHPKWAACAHFLRDAVCEPAGPLFDVVMKNADPKLAALEAQCIHTDADNLGTRERNCNQDWLMGYCGETQAGAKWVGVVDYPLFSFSFTWIHFSYQTSSKWWSRPVSPILQLCIQILIPGGGEERDVQPNERCTGCNQMASQL